MKGFDDHLDNYGDPNPGDENPFESAIALVTGSVPCQVFRRTVNYGGGDYPDALLLGDDGSFVVHVAYDGSMEEAYLINEPIEDAAHCCMGEPGDELKGFTNGFTC